MTENLTMFNFVYKWLSEYRSRSYDLRIKEAIDVIEKYNLWYQGDLDSAGGSVLIPDIAYFKVEDGKKTVYDLFYYNLHIHVSASDKEEIFSVRIKSPDGKWLCLRTDAPLDGKMRFITSRPSNSYYEVYVWYHVPVLDLTTANGYIYKHGSWDKYVYQTMENFFEDIDEFKDVSKFNSYYKK